MSGTEKSIKQKVNYLPGAGGKERLKKVTANWYKDPFWG